MYLLCKIHKQLENTKHNLKTVQGQLKQYQKSKEETALTGITKHDITGAILEAGVQSYYAINDTQDIIAQKQAGIVQYPFLTYGTFSTNLTPVMRYGLPFSVKMGGVVMDIDKILHTKVEINNDRKKLTAYSSSRGPSYSLNENLVPEQLFDNPDTVEKEADGISAVKALQLAAQQGQTIYTITKANYAEVLPKLNHSDVVMTDIRNGINANKTVTVHDTQINFNGWKGTGYTILDPDSGAGAYMIGGGLDGGFTNGAVLGTGLGILALSMDTVIKYKVANAQLTTAATLLLSSFLLGFLAGTIIIAAIQKWGDEAWGCFFSDLTYSLTITTLGTQAKGGVISKTVASIVTLVTTALGWSGRIPSPASCLGP